MGNERKPPEDNPGQGVGPDGVPPGQGGTPPGQAKPRPNQDLPEQRPDNELPGEPSKQPRRDSE